MRLAEMRERKGWSQAELAEALGVTQSAVGNWESGIRLPRPRTLQRLASLFGVTIDYLLTDADHASTSERTA
jgi:transcriptional regulator with XRE-family HTH domain